MRYHILFTIFLILTTNISYGQIQSDALGNYLNLDSVVIYEYSGKDSVRYRKDVYSYEKEGNQLQDVKYWWSTNLNSWIAYEKYSYDFDSSGNKTNEVKYKYNKTSDAWIENSKYEYCYGKYDNRTTTVFFTWQSKLNKWINLSKDELIIDDHGNTTYEARYVWDSELYDWRVDFRNKYKYIYDDLGNTVSVEGYKWDLAIDDWYLQAKEKYEYRYDEAGKNTEKIIIWENFQIDYSYTWLKDYNYFDEFGNLALTIRYRRDSYGDDWYYVLKYEYSYDKAGNRVEQMDYSWNNDLNDWLFRFKTEWEYDSAGNLILFKDYNESVPTVWEYDSSGNLLLEIKYSNGSRNKFENIFDESGNKIVVINYTWERINNTENWKVDTKEFYYYSNPSTGSHLSANENIICYPNPTNGIMTISGIKGEAVVNLFNINGQLLKSFNTVQNTIDISEIPKGIYFLELILKDKTVTQKVVKE